MTDATRTESVKAAVLSQVKKAAPEKKILVQRDDLAEPPPPTDADFSASEFPAEGEEAGSNG